MMDQSEIGITLITQTGFFTTLLSIYDVPIKDWDYLDHLDYFDHPVSLSIFDGPIKDWDYVDYHGFLHIYDETIRDWHHFIHKIFLLARLFK